MNAVLADTGPLYALVDSSDSLHVRARHDAKRLKRAGLRVIVSRSTACEAHALLLRRVRASVVQTWLQDLKRGCALINPGSVHYEAAVRRLASLPDQSITLFDAVLAEVADHLDMPVWTYDHHFDVMSVAVWRGGD